jgi:hypothetical protein
MLMTQPQVPSVVVTHAHSPNVLPLQSKPLSWHACTSFPSQHATGGHGPHGSGEAAPEGVASDIIAGADQATAAPAPMRLSRTAADAVSGDV